MTRSHRFSRPAALTALSFFALAFSHAASDQAAAKKPAKNIDEEVVSLEPLNVVARSEEGYSPVAATQVGPLGARDLLDTPFAIGVVPSDLIRNTQAVTPDDIFKLNPVTQLNTPHTRFFTGVNMRGFSSASTKRIDGVPSTSSFLPVDVEDKESIEIITGLSGFLYGSGNVGGTINYVLKRPTATRLNRITVGNTSGANIYAHADLGGPLDADGKFGYRVNLLGQDGDTATDFQSLERRFISTAFDWHVSENLTLRLDASYSFKRLEGTEPYWTAAPGVDYPSAPDPDQYYGQPFSFTESIQHHIGGGFDWVITPDVKLRAGYAHREGTTDLTAVNNRLEGGGSYTAQASTWEYPDVVTDGGYVMLDWEVSTGPLDHRVTAGFYGDLDERTNYRSSAGGWAALPIPAATLDNPVYVNTPPPGATGPKYTAGRTINRNFVIGDSISVGERWTALLGLNRTTIADRAFNAAGATTTRYNETKVTPTVSLIFKPVERLSFYANYMESLEKGGTAPALSGGVPVVNAGEVMPPLMSDQYEIGAKARVGRVLLTAALFQIDKGLQYTDTTDPLAPVYVQDGRQVHRGLEFTATGKVLDSLTLVGGFTVLDAEVKDNASNPALEGKTPTNVAEVLAKAYAEYDVGERSGLILTGGLYYTGSQYVNTLNTDSVPSYVTADLGFRYESTLSGMPFVTRLNVSNITNEAYWMNSFYVGAPRTVRLSATLEF